MVFNNNLLLGAAGQSGAFDTTLIERSAWFDGVADKLTKTFGTDTRNGKGVISVWVRRHQFGTRACIIGTAGVLDMIEFDLVSGQLHVRLNNQEWTSNALYRDISWYHILVSWDMAAVGTARVQVLVNGEEISYLAQPTLSTQPGYFKNVAHYIGTTGTSTFWKGSMAQFTALDGRSIQNGDYTVADFLDAYTFGVNGSQYVPRADADIAALATAAGGNSFCLTTAIGDGTDASGNGNNFTPTSMSDAANGSADTPSNQHALLNPLASNGTVSNGAQVWTVSGVGAAPCTIYAPPNSGSYYAKCTITSAGTGRMVGVVGSGFYYRSTDTRYPGDTGTGLVSIGYFGPNGRKYINGSNSAYGSTFTSADEIGVKIDTDNGEVTFYKNGTGQGAISYDNTVPVTFCSGYADGSGSTTQTWDFAATPPADEKTLNSANLPMPDYQGIDYFNPILYTGNGSTNAITGVGFQPDLVWIKNRTGTTSHSLYDAVRGVQEQIESDNTSAETTETTGLTAFGSDGFTVGLLAQVNTNTNNFVGWSWLAGGAGASNTDGSITSTVSKAAADHFSIGTYTGNATAGATIGHGLGGTPELILYKKLSGIANWIVYSETAGAGNSDYLMLDQSGAKGFAGAINWANSTVPTATVATLGSDGNNNATAGTYVFYAFRSVPGVCKIGSYTGNGSANGAFIYTDFKAAWIMIKRYNSSGAWTIFDNQREGYNVDNDELVANTTAAETTTDYVDILSNGFKLRSTDADVNASGGGYIFMAFADIAGDGDLPPIYGR
jgi:hypothetical protein